MADQKFKFQEFYELILEAKAGEYDKPLKIYEQLLYATAVNGECVL